MSTNVVFKVAGSDVSATVTPDWNLTTQAAKFTAGISGFNLDDKAAGITIPGLKPVTVDVGTAVTPRMYTGYTTQRTIGRNDVIMGSADVDRRWQVQVADPNAVLGDLILRGAHAKRPAETDIARITWLLGSGFIPLVFDHGFIDASLPAPMDATDFTGQYPYDVLVKCSEATGYNGFVAYREASADLTLHYRLDGSSTSWTSDVLISNHPADIDNINVFAPDGKADLTLDPRNTYSGALLTVGNGLSVYATNPATVSAFRAREISVTDSQVGRIATARAYATAYLARVNVEIHTIKVTIKLNALDVNRVQAGMRMQIKLTEEPGYTSYQYVNVQTRTVRPAEEGQRAFYLDLVLENLVNTGFHGSTLPPGTSNPAPGPPSTPPPTGSCGITDTFDRPDTNFNDAYHGSPPPPYGWGVGDCGVPWTALGGGVSIGAIQSNTAELQDVAASRVGNELVTSLPFPLALQITFNHMSLFFSWFGCRANSAGITIEVEFDVGGTQSVALSISDGSNTVLATAGLASIPDLPFTFTLTVGATGATVFGLTALVANATPSPIAALTDVSNPYVAHEDSGGGTIVDNLNIDDFNRCTAGGSPITGRSRSGIIGTGNGVTTAFTIPGGYLGGSVAVWVSGDLQTVTELDPVTGDISVSPAPANTKLVNATWTS